MKKFPLITGRLGLDLVNTEFKEHGKKRDLLLNGTDLSDWIAMEKKGYPFLDDYEMGITGGETFRLLDGLKSYRSFLRRNFEDAADSKDVSEILAQQAEEKINISPLTLRMLNGHVYPYPVGAHGDALSALISVDVLKFIEDGNLQIMKRCGNPECMLLFIDATGRRKWCSMNLCGNRMKAIRYRNR